MQYFGGKVKISKELTKYLESIRNDNQLYIEPFVGGGSVISKMTGDREGYDKNNYLINMYNELQKGWIPPDELTKEEYNYIKENKDELPHLTSFVGFGCSFAGKWFGGYAKSNGRNYCKNAKNSILKKMKTLSSVKFKYMDFFELEVENTLIYCDPPYKDYTGYDAIGEFDSDLFWKKVRTLSKNNTVVVSEYHAPDDFEVVWEKFTKTDIRTTDVNNMKRTEKLFRYKGE